MRKYFLMAAIAGTALGCSGQGELNGRVSLSELQDEEWFDSAFNEYRVDEATIEKLREADFRVVAFGGAWCPDTRRMLPSYMKVLDVAGKGGELTDVWMLDQNFNSGGGPEKNLGIRSVPTFVIYQDKKEVGRIGAGEKQSPEKAFLKIVK